MEERKERKEKQKYAAAFISAVAGFLLLVIMSVYSVLSVAEEVAEEDTTATVTVVHGEKSVGVYIAEEFVLDTNDSLIFKARYWDEPITLTGSVSRNEDSTRYIVIVDE